MPRGKNLTPEQKKDIIEAYTSGMNRAEVATMFDLAPTTVNRIVRENGWSSHRALPKLEPVAEKLVTVDAQNFVQNIVEKAREMRPSNATNLGRWEVKFTGSLIVEAETIDQALTEARKLGIVKRVYSAHLKGK
jgi:transposase-like protein